MRLTARDNPETIKRYAHVRPARIWEGRKCGVKCPGIVRTCTRKRGHRGPHVAHGFLGKVEAAWDSGPAASPARAGGVGSLTAGDRARHRLRKRKPLGMLETLAVRVRSVVSSPEDVAFIALFIIMVWFAVDTALRILGVR